jgi:tRNA G18 (ribose-2'-O)-methylase SpoU
MVLIRECLNAGCQFRFPAADDSPTDMGCPKCGALTRVAASAGPSPKVPFGDGRQPGPEIEILLDNIRSAFNVGSMFRTADGAGILRLHLCGMTPTPENPKTWKTALGAERSVQWTYHRNGLAAGRALQARGMRLWALEGGPGSVSIFEAARSLEGTPLALVVGNEISGVDPGILEACECVVHIPMEGVKRSLNVAIAFGIAVYFLRYLPVKTQ